MATQGGTNLLIEWKNFYGFEIRQVDYTNVNLCVNDKLVPNRDIPQKDFLVFN